MDFNSILKFVWQDALFSFIIIAISFCLGWVLYDKVILRKIKLSEALFDKDNFAAWVEFIGAFIFPALYLAAKAVSGSVSDNIWIDLLVSGVYAVSYVVMFAVLRLLSGKIVKFIGTEDSHGKVELNNEIYVQKNVAASLFSVALSVIFANIVTFLDVLPQYFPISVLKMLGIFVLTTLAIIVYFVILRRRTTLFKELFVDNNIAAGIHFVGFVFAIQTILCNIFTYGDEFDFTLALVMSLAALTLFGIISFVLKSIFCKIVKIGLYKEIFEENNKGAALGQIALYIGVANIIVNFLK
ncbi:DUF350 domain-containing protein [Acetivibrio cellulolyticus]|uniref:DUF350 domain-containing protein n=1 Tax=Acetivibrio cellulolyticus TaxID=35830 RepID=UPI0001E2F568|nr:hypothetical protein [Acetivibrio cellulolyticus]